MDDSALETFIADVDAARQPLVRALDRAVLAADPDLTAAVKWRQLTYALAGDFHHWICSIDVTKKRVSLRFHFGGLLEDPRQVFRAGASEFFRTIDFVAAGDLEPELVTDYVRRAVARTDDFKAAWRERQRSA